MQLSNGGLEPGDALPTQAVLMREFGASSLTVQRAMALPKQDGWAVSRPGKGAFVAHHDHGADDADDLDGPEEIAPATGTARVEALEYALAECSADCRSSWPRRLTCVAPGSRGRWPAPPAAGSSTPRRSTLSAGPPGPASAPPSRRPKGALPDRFASA